jgi:hypothetical protein
VFHSLQFIQDPFLIPICHASEIPTVIHGTYFKNWTKIKTEGLSRMNRLHIHFSPGETGDSQVVSGMRSSCQLYIYIDAEKALAGKNVTFTSSFALLHYYGLAHVTCQLLLDFFPFLRKMTVGLRDRHAASFVPPLQHLKQLTYFHEIWCEFYAVGGQLNLILLIS